MPILDADRVCWSTQFAELIQPPDATLAELSDNLFDKPLNP
jgi:hypothetical protein